MNNAAVGVPRRTVAKGVAWTAPTLAFGSMAPVVAASAGCPSPSCWRITPPAGSGMTYVASQIGASSGGVSADSSVQLNLGWWSLTDACTVPGAAYYRERIYRVDAVDTTGARYTSEEITGGFLQYGDQAGGSEAPTIIFRGFESYGAPIWNPTHRLVEFTIHFTWNLLDLGFNKILPADLDCTLTFSATCRTATDCGTGGLSLVG